uniref:Uncharacterized protein n=1 Tax=Avena sativa TaxID=4498 RepID=A0ACD5Y678_AVESA
MVVDSWEEKPDGAVRPSWPRGGPVNRGWPHSPVRSYARTRPWPPPPPAFAAYGRQEGGSGVSRARRGFGVHGEERDEAAAVAAAGGNAGGDLVGGGAERFSGLVAGVVAREARGSGGGVGGLGWRRGLTPAASPPPPKRRGLSSTRRFPSISAREPAAPVVRSGGEDGLRVGASASHGGFGSEEGVLLSAVLEKVVAAKGGALVADWYPHGPEAMVGKTSHASVGNAAFSKSSGAGGFFGAWSDQLGKKQLETPAVQGQELEEGEIAETMEITQGMVKNDALIERQELEEGEIAATMDNVEGMNKNVLDGPVEGHKLEEGATMDIVGVMVKGDLDGPVEAHELEEGMDIVVATKKDALNGSVDGQEFEEGEIASPLDIVEALNDDTLDGAVEVQEFVQGVIATTMDTVESMNNQALHEVVVMAQELEESEIAALDIVEGTNMDMFVGPVENQKLKDEIAAKGHGQEPDDSEIATKSDHSVQQSHFSVDIIPCDSTAGIMRSKIKFTATKTDHTAEESRISVDVIPHDSTGGIMRKKIKFTVGKTVQPPAKANHMSQFIPLDRPLSSTSATTMKKFKAAQSKTVPIDLASASALTSKEKRKFEPVFVSKEELKGKRAVFLEDDDILKAVAVHGGRLELCLNAPSRVRSVWRHGPHGGGQKADHRSRVRLMCRRFQFLCRFLAQAVKQGSMELPRVDLAADNVIKKLPDYIKYGSLVGEVDGVEVGDEFLFRVELAIVGLHNPYRAGIDTTKDTDGELIAVSIVASGGYLDEYSSSGELIYIGSGGKAAGTDQDGDQKLERGNLALKNCIKREIPVRVTHGFKTPNREEGSHSIGKEIPNFIYDGLYHVVGFWQDGIPGSRVFKYKLRRIRGQPKLPLHVAKWLRESVVRPR